MNASAYTKMGVENPIDSKMATALTQWIDLYKGKAPWLATNHRSLKLPSRIAETLAITAMVENDISVTGSIKAEMIDEIIKRIKPDMITNVEYAVAMGGIVFKPYFDGKEISVDYVHADDFYPIAFSSNRQITDAMFIDRITKGDKVYSRVERHTISDKVYTITNKAFVGRAVDDYGYEVPLNQVPEWAGIEPEVEIVGMKMPMFAYLRMPFGNKIDPKSPLGVSVYADAIDLIEEADIQFQRLQWEYEGSELAIDANEDAFELDVNGEPILPVGRERLYRTNKFDPREMSGGELIKTFSPVIRDEAYLRGLNNLLKQIEDKVGLATGTLSDQKSDVRTADEVRANRQKTYVTVCTIQRAVQSAIEQLIFAIEQMMTLYGIHSAGNVEIKCQWDDSVITDPDVERNRDRLEVTQGLMASWEYRVKWFGETEEVAKAAILSIKGEELTDVQIMGFDR